jgi:hypothetical protein
MSKYRKKPIVVEAVQFHPDTPRPAGVCDCLEPKPVPGELGAEFRRGPHIHTLEGPMLVSPGDWIITGVKGERYPCKPDIFAASYEPVDDAPPPEAGE